MSAHAALRAQLHERIAKAERAKLADRVQADQGCEHEWQTFRQTVVPNSLRFKGAGAYFIVKGCIKCKAKRLVRYVMEKA